MPLSQECVDAVADLLNKRAGFRPDPVLNGRLARCIEDAVGDASLADYLVRLASDRRVFADLVDRVTIQESSFFRDAGQFDAVATLLAESDTSGVVWSAGCANGQEPWSLAMVLAEMGRTDWRIVATDISARALERAAAGHYSERELRGLSAERRARFIDRGRVVPALRELVSFAPFNLTSTVLPLAPQSCSIAFCRNVLIYLTDEEIERWLERLWTVMAPAGLLFLGYSESLWRLRSRFVLRRLGETFAYGTGPVTRAPKPRATPPAAPSAAPADEADRFVAVGRSALASGDSRTAIDALRKAVYLRPTDAAAHLYLGFAFEGSGDPDGALRCFKRARRELAASAPPAAGVVEGWDTAELLHVLDGKLGMAS